MDLPNEEVLLTCYETLIELDVNRLPISTDDRLATFIEADGECYLVFPQGMCEKMGWRIGDTLAMQCMAETQTLIIKKKNRVKIAGK